MCRVTKIFTRQGFEVKSVSCRNDVPLVEVSSIPVNYRLNKEATCHITEKFNGKTRVLRVGRWRGCNVAVIESIH